jgi:hypothetical protein
LFDWVLRNTSGWHYARGKKSLEEFEVWLANMARSDSPSMNPQQENR